MYCLGLIDSVFEFDLTEEATVEELESEIFERWVLLGEIFQLKSMWWEDHAGETEEPEEFHLDGLGDGVGIGDEPRFSVDE